MSKPEILQEGIVIVPSVCPRCGKVHYFSMDKKDYDELDDLSIREIEELSNAHITDTCF